MRDADNLLNDIQEALHNKKPPYIEKRNRLHPDELLYRTLQVLEDLMSEIREQQDELVDLEDKYKDLVEVVDDLEDQISELVKGR
jgi:chromosome segregation ATPase